MNDKKNIPADMTPESVGAVNTNGYTEPLYDVGTKLQKRDAPSSFGSVIKRKYANGQWFYTIMGSVLNPIEAAENELEPKSR